MNTGILGALHTFYPSCTPVDRDIADYVLAHGSEVVYMTITELAYRCSVCETSIMRFCRKLGVSGYPQFRLALSSSLTAQQHMPGQALHSDDPLGKLMDDVYRKYIFALTNTRAMQSTDQFGTIVEHVSLARQVYFFGLDSSLTTAFFSSQIMMKLMRKGIFAMEAYTQKIQASLLTSFDMAFLFSKRGSNEDLLEIAGKLKAQNAYTVAVTCCGDSPLTKLCDANLYCCCSDDPTKPSELDSVTGKAASFFIIESICTACLRMVELSKEQEALAKQEASAKEYELIKEAELDALLPDCY